MKSESGLSLAKASQPLQPWCNASKRASGVQMRRAWGMRGDGRERPRCGKFCSSSLNVVSLSLLSAQVESSATFQVTGVASEKECASLCASTDQCTVYTFMGELNPLRQLRSSLQITNRGEKVRNKRYLFWGRKRTGTCASCSPPATCSSTTASIASPEFFSVTYATSKTRCLMGVV